MRIPRRWAHALAMHLFPYREPDLVIGEADRPYLRRWYLLPRNPVFNVYLHQFKRSDDDRALHDHPWVNMSVVLLGRYVEHTIDAGGIHRRQTRHGGDIVFRLPRRAHRVEIAPRTECWTLFITGPRVREWGFHCPGGWRHWREFTAGDRGERVGRGCD